MVFFYGGVFQGLIVIEVFLHTEPSKQKNIRTCVPRVNDALNDMFVIKLCEGEGVKMLVHHHVFCLNVDG